MKNFIASIVSLGLVAFCFSSLFAVYRLIEIDKTAQATAEAVQAVNAEAQTEQERMFDRQAELAEKGFAANVAIAASGDVAQASMVKSFSSVFWAVAVALALTCVLIFLVKFQPSRKQAQPVNERDFERERNRL